MKGLFEHGSREDFCSALEQSWVAGSKVTRYSRTWRLSKSTKHKDDLWFGHIGFVKTDELSTLDWDNEAKDFVRGEASSGVIVPFLINNDHRIVSFQLFPGKVRPITVTRNLEALLNSAGTYSWSIKPVALPSTLDEWLTSVDGVSTLNVLLKYPNPDWTGRDKLKVLVEGLKAELVRVKATAAEGDAINLDSGWFKQAMDHVRQGYGKADLKGLDSKTGTESRYVETSEGGAVQAIDRIAAKDDALEVTEDDLRGAQKKLSESHPEGIGYMDTDEELEDEKED